MKRGEWRPLLRATTAGTVASYAGARKPLAPVLEAAARQSVPHWTHPVGRVYGSRANCGPIVSTMRAVLAVVVAVIAVIVVLKVVAAVSALVLAFVPAIIALGGGYAAGQIHGARRERRKLEATHGGQLPK